MNILTVNGMNHAKYAGKIKELYGLCFDDSPEYIEYFVSGKITADSSLLMFDGDKLISMLFFTMKKLRIFTDLYPVPFLYACATHPDYRGQRHMTSLLLVFSASIRRTGLPFIMLHPFDRAYYGRVGFETVDYRYEHTVGEGNDVIVEADCDTVENLRLLLSGATDSMDIASVRDLGDWRLKLTELRSDGGKAYIAYGSGGEAKGYFLVSNGKTEEAVMQADVSCGREKELCGTRYLSTLPSVSIIPNNLIRICNAESALKIFSPYLPADFTFSLIDPQLPKNSGLYRIAGGTSTKLPSDGESASTDIELDIRTLTKALFGAHRFDTSPDWRIAEFFPFRTCSLLDEF